MNFIHSMATLAMIYYSTICPHVVRGRLFSRIKSLDLSRGVSIDNNSDNMVQLPNIPNITVPFSVSVDVCHVPCDIEMSCRNLLGSRVGAFLLCIPVSELFEWSAEFMMLCPEFS